MRMRGVWSIVAIGCALSAAAALAAGSGAGRIARPAPRISGPLAVVLLPAIDGCELAVADLDAGRVVSRVRLRSLATDLSVDDSTGLVVAAQSGGIGRDADDALSITDVRTGRVRYVTLPVTDPGDVACLAGRAFVLHAVLEASGTAVSVVDVAAGRVVARGNVVDCAGAWRAAAGRLWTATGDGDRDSPTLATIASDTLEATAALAGGAPVFGIAEAAGRVVLLGPDAAGDAPGRGLVRLLDPGTRRVVTGVRTGRLARAPRQAVEVAGRLVVGDWSGDEPEGRVLEVLDAATLRAVGAVELDGIPCALAAWGSRLLAVDRVGARLLVVDPGSGRTMRAIELGVRDLVFSDVVVLEGEGGAD